MDDHPKLTKEELQALTALRGNLRYIVAQLVISIMRTLSDTRFGGGDMHRNVDEILIAVALCLGEYEGRPMTPYKLAQFLGMPRSTLLRKSDAMVKAGYLWRDKKALRLNEQWAEGGPDGLGLTRQVAATLQAVRRLTASVDDEALAMLARLDPRHMA